MKAIITGLGSRGLNWINVLKLRNDVEVTAYIEPTESARQRAISEHGVPADRIHSSLDAALDNSSADFVLDVTPPSVHEEVATKAFSRGLHVLGEKPLSDNLATAKEIVAHGNSAAVKHMITQNYRFTQQPRNTRPLIESGLIGKPGQCDVRFYMPWADMPGSHYVSEPYMFINDMMVHHFDLIRYVLGQNPESVQAITWNHSWGWHKGDAAHIIVFRYSDGLVVTHTANACAVGSQTSWNGDWRIEGPKGSLEWDRSGGITYSHRHRAGVPTEKAIPLTEVRDPGQAILDEFFAAIREDREPECSAQDNLRSLAMVFAAIQSAKEGRVVMMAEL